MVAGIRWAVEQEVDAISIAAGIPRKKWGLFPCHGNCEVCKAADEAANAGIGVYVAAGNDPKEGVCPATVGLMKTGSKVKSVAAIDPKTGAIASYSAPGNTSAPTGDMYFLRYGAEPLEFARAYAAMATRCADQNDYDQAIDCCKEVLNALNADVSQTRDEKVMRLGAFVNIGSAYRNKSEYAKAIEYYHKAKPILDNLGVGLDYGKLWKGIADVYSDMGDRSKVINYLSKAAAAFVRIEYYGAEYWQALNSLGLAQVNNGDYDQAILHYHQALAIVEATEGAKSQPAIFIRINLALALSEQKEIRDSTQYLNEALAISRKIGFRPGKSASTEALEILQVRSIVDNVRNN